MPGIQGPLLSSAAARAPCEISPLEMLAARIYGFCSFPFMAPAGEELARDERCSSGRDGRGALQRLPSRVRILGILLSQPSTTSSSLSLLQHSHKTIWSQSGAPAAQLWGRSCPQEPPAGFSSALAVKCWLGQGRAAATELSRGTGASLAPKGVWAGGEG